ncbi:putative RNA-binding protein orb2 [Hypsibius exemplaris]|uniref:RNA-binding protein orb2 n=1 Tax=Hypsibius exemplaris TaxID=2072580 RepID=A0A1W0XC54_HYPEX|nr:putative RNA-binding protein orb2 [Hypsibius exemplaris]
MDVEAAFRPFSSPFDFAYNNSAGTESPLYSSSSSSSSTGSGSSRLLEFIPDTPTSLQQQHSSIWSSPDSKEANHHNNSQTDTTVASPGLPDLDTTTTHEKSMTTTAAGTGRESSSPPTSAAVSVSSSLENGSGGASSLTDKASLFGCDSVWSSSGKAGSFTDLGSFGSTEEERRYLADGANGKTFLRPPGSSSGAMTTTGSNSSSSNVGTWGSFWSDLSPSLSPSNSESNLHQHFGSPTVGATNPSVTSSVVVPSASVNPFATWNQTATVATNSVNRTRSGPVNGHHGNGTGSPFSSGSVSPINGLRGGVAGKPLSPNLSMPAPPHNHHQQQPYRTAYNTMNGGPTNGQPSSHHGMMMNGSNGFVQRHHQQYRRSVSHPNPQNGHLLHSHSHHHQQQQNGNGPHHHLQQQQSQYYNGTGNNGMNNGFEVGFYGSNNGIGNNNLQFQQLESAFSDGWNMEPATTTTGAINGYHQDNNNNNAMHNPRNYHSSPGGTTTMQNSSNGMDGNLKYCFDPQMNDIMRATGWDDNGKGKSFFGSYASYDGSRTHSGGYSDPLLDPFDQMVPASISPMGSRMSPRNHSSSSAEFGDHMHVFSRKVFVGGLPPDIDEEEITTSFRRFGPLIVDWPHKAESKSYFPPKGYAFLLFQDESSVQTLMEASVQEGDKTYFYVSSPTNKDKPVQVRPWRLTDNECYLDAQSKLDPRLTVFVGGVPRPLRAQELAVLMNQRFGYVAYAGIDVDSELKYPKGAGRITFSNQQSYIAAINARFVQLQNGEIDKRVELKPYVLDDQICDYCHGMKCSGRSAPLFCSQVGCLAYLCEHCWTPHHSSPGKEHHKPVTKESSVDRSRPAAMRW